MSDELEKRKAMSHIQRANQADELLSNPLYREAIVAMESAMFEQFKDSKFSDPDQRHELWQRMQLMKQFQAKFEHIVKQGEKAKETLSMLDIGKKMIRKVI